MKKSLVKGIISLLLVLAATFSFPKSCQTQGLDNIGYAPFNITANKFNCKGFISALAPLKVIHLSFLYNTFGNNFECLERIIKDERVKTLQIHLVNEPGHRNKRLGDYEFLYNIDSPGAYNTLLLNQDETLRLRYFEYVRPLQNFIQNSVRSDIEVIITPGLESNLSVNASKILFSWTKELFPNSRLVFNPYPFNSNRERVGADFLESHGLFPQVDSPCIFNLDGADISFPNRLALGQKSYEEGQTKNWIQSGTPLFQLYEEMANKCEYVFLWTAESNGLKTGKFIDPRLRKNVISTRMYRTIISEIVTLSRKGKVYPLNLNYDEQELFIEKDCSEVRTNFEDGAKRGNLLKQSEFRGRGAVLLLSKSFSTSKKVKLYHKNKIVDSFKRVQNYKDGRPMFRSGKSPTKYPLKTFLVIEEKNKKICYKLANPRIRLD